MVLGKRRCEVCERKRLALAEERLMDSWLCLFFPDVFCPYSQIPKEKRMVLKCDGCEYYERVEREMEEEEIEDAAFVEAVERDPDGYLRGDF
jgi:CRISPR/Cas system-associated protein Cas10 (large subunit of type III CRISPR-Cas system)